MASKSGDAELEAEVLAEAKQVVERRRRAAQYAKAPWWVCSGCGFENHPRPTHPGHTKCEQCGKERDENDPTMTGPNGSKVRDA